MWLATGNSPNLGNSQSVLLRSWLLVKSVIRVLLLSWSWSLEEVSWSQGIIEVEVLAAQISYLGIVVDRGAILEYEC